jgi:hypothetical protein
MTYEPNTWGPAEADPIVVPGGGWHNPTSAAQATQPATP